MPNTENKNSQFFENYLRNILPLQGLGRSLPLTTKEAKVLMDIWSSETDINGRKLVPITIDFKTVESLIAKGMLHNTSKRAVSLYPVGNYVELTKSGKDIIKSIILYTEKSAFEKKANDWTIEDIYPKKIKTASVHRQSRNWLERAIK